MERVLCKLWGGLGVGCRTGPVQAEQDSAHCSGMNRAARELSRAASAERNMLCCRSNCGLDCAKGQ